MGQALYRKYRSKTLTELVGQEHITTTLEKAIKSGRISHAYLFTGPRGVGKTSTARILAHAINDLPYGDGQTHLDIIEIDAASNNSVEDIRDLREKVYVAPSVGKYKVYIIDEVHMLSKAAFNAILKTLEEPPAHVVFILATTEAHRLPETIVSRTQRFVFRPVETAKVVAHLRSIAKAEKITITDEALELLAAHGTGSFRDSISLLDQASSLHKHIDADDIRSLIGMPPATTVEELASLLTQPTGGRSLDLLYQLYDQGFQAAAIAKVLGETLRGKLLNESLVPTVEVMQLLSELLEVPISHDPERYLEIVILKLSVQPAATPAKAAPQLEPQPAPAVSQPPRPTPRTRAKAAASPAPTTESPKAATEPKPPPKNKGGLPVDDVIWNDVLQGLKKQHNTLYSIVRMANVVVEQQVITLTFAFAFHQKRINEAKNRKILSDILEQVTGQAYEIVCVHDPDMKAVTAPQSSHPLPEIPPVVPDASLATISNIFGGGELLES